MRRTAALLVVIPVSAVASACEEQPARPLVESIPTAVGIVLVSVAVFVWLWTWMSRAKPVEAGAARVRPVARAIVAVVVSGVPIASCYLVVLAAYDVGFSYREPGSGLFGYGFSRMVLIAVSVFAIGIGLTWGRFMVAIWLGRIRAIVGAVLLTATGTIGFTLMATHEDFGWQVVLLAVGSCVGFVAASVVLWAGSHTNEVPEVGRRRGSRLRSLRDSS